MISKKIFEGIQIHLTKLLDRSSNELVCHPRLNGVESFAGHLTIGKVDETREK